MYMESRCAYRTTAAGNLRGDRSFSSTLLDAIYNSIDESSHDLRQTSRSKLRGGEEERVSSAMMMKSSSASVDRRSRIGDSAERKSRDRWMQKTSIVNEDVIRRRSLPPETATEFAGLRSAAMASNRRRSLESMKVHSSPMNSSNTSSGGRVSSHVDADVFSASKKRSSLKPIRTSFSNHRSETFQSVTQTEEVMYRKKSSSSADPRPPKSDSAGKSAKSRAMKLYGDLKRMKQPISPGGKLANFLNSLFSTSGGSKKQRISSSSPPSAPAAGKLERDSKSNFSSYTTPSISSASSYSRSCLSKRPSSAGKYDCVKRSVKFCPISVIVDEDLRPCGHKSLRGSEDLEASKARSGEELKVRMLEKNRRVEEMARDLLRNYQQRRELAARKDLKNEGDEEMVDDDDVESCCSSDLFELEIGVDRFCQELPVYETTRVETNRAIASRLMA